jgi:hypothetical protein
MLPNQLRWEITGYFQVCWVLPSHFYTVRKDVINIYQSNIFLTVNFSALTWKKHEFLQFWDCCTTFIFRLRFEASTMIISNDVFLGDEPCEDGVSIQCFRHCLCLHHKWLMGQGTQPQVVFIPQSILMVVPPQTAGRIKGTVRQSVCLPQHELLQ